MARECKVIVSCGKKGVGKSVETIKMIFDYVRGNPAKGVPPRKALIFDVNDEFSSFWYYDQQLSIKAIAIKDIQRYSLQTIAEVRRIRPFWDDGKKLTLDDMAKVLGLILDNYRGGLLLIEDPNKYVGDNIDSDLIGGLATARHIGLDCVMHFQGVGRVAHPKIIQNANFIRYHKTNDTVKRHERKFEDKFALMSIAESLVNARYASGDHRFFVYVDVDNSKILGAFTKDEAAQAIVDHIGDYYQTIVKKISNKIDTKGNRIYTKETALQAAIDDFMKSYFIFDKDN